jgi:hypothetical protein
VRGDFAGGMDMKKKDSCEMTTGSDAKTMNNDLETINMNLEDIESDL